MLKFICCLMLLLSFSCASKVNTNKFDKKITYNNESCVDILFAINGRITERSFLTIVDSVNKKSNPLPKGWRRTLGVDSLSYNEFLKKILELRCIKDSFVLQNNHIEFDIIKYGHLTERFRLDNLAQIKEYLIVSNYLFGERNYIPYELNIDSLK